MSQKSDKTKLILQLQNDSDTKTYVDSLYNSNIKDKENINFNTYQNIITEIYLPKIKQIQNETNNNKKEKNFYLALKTLNLEKNISNNTSKTSKNLISKISEFSEMNPDKSKDYNVSKYLHHPITKQITKLGNQLIKRQNYNEYRVYNGFEINKPLVSVYNMKNIFEKFDISYLGIENSTTNSKINKNDSINNNDIENLKRKKLKYFHRKNKSSITNYYFNENNKNSCRTLNNYYNYNKRKNYAFHFRNNMSSFIGYQNKIIFNDRDSATTITKEEYNKDAYIHDFNGININIFNQSKNLEVINDFDETKENKIYSTNKKKNGFIESKSNNKGFNINKIFSSRKKNLKKFEQNYNLSINKTLRKKYERTDLALRNFEGKIIHDNNLLINNLMNKFEQCSQNKNLETIVNNISENLKENSDNKNNETFIINNVENNFGLNLEMSENNNSSMKSNNIHLSQISSNKLNSNISNNNIRRPLKLNSINSKDENQISKSEKSYQIYNKNKIEQINLNQNIYETPLDSNKNNHHFCLDSIFSENINDTNEQYYIPESINNIKNNNEEELSPTVFDYTFYQKLMKKEDIMTQNYKIIYKKELIIKSELRLEILLWMMKTCEEFAFKRDTFHNASFYFDMFLSSISLNSSKLKNHNLKDKSYIELIGLTCIVISAKIEEIQLPRLKEYHELLNSKYNINSIIEMEKKICSQLRWKLIIITRNTWLSWYICQWDLYIDTVDNIKEEFCKLISEDDILYFKKPNDNSYSNFRKISQLIDIMVLDYHSYNYESRILVAISFFIIICNNYQLKYNFAKKNFDNNTLLSKLLLNTYTKFVLQSFDYDFNNDKIQKGIKYFYNNYINFPFVFELPLLYQIHPNKLDGDSYEDFLSYQTTNDNFMKIIKEKININNDKNTKRIIKKINKQKKK